jgi:hypothetical protein
MSHASLRVDRTGEYSLRLTGSGNQIFVGAQNVVTRLELAGSDNKVNLESHVLYRAVVNSGQRNCLLDFNFENWDAAFCPGLLQ